ncbi:hypothetical protein P175DRAFT_0520955 [Aspergillus ochraceoroseus IBT 24754]|uniref:Uncharacterized protein n=1 Tax=Aspergillus ochraceoroseus IBT 24754 TaxID=1392256 RepID=A0A2T5M9E4_9EURO|nr:uncharacterized protein P175DRAFT_0520955 [Aspergillus ochraceoroseus IBT 24754]PTU25147.1 hypothetical protein P175DRAFT_0520955 [Aspergillus ochraceoroseus IBT 24754]
MSSKPLVNPFTRRYNAQSRSPLDTFYDVSPQKVLIEGSGLVNTEQATPGSEWKREEELEYNLLKPPQEILYLVSPSPSPSRHISDVSYTPTPLKRIDRLFSSPTSFDDAFTNSHYQPTDAFRSASMASQRLSSRPQGHSVAGRNLGSPFCSQELHDNQDLASSQPVSLIQLYNKTHSSRNKTGKSLKPPRLGCPAEMVAGSTTFPEIEQNKPSEDFTLGGNTEYSTPISRTHSLGHPWDYATGDRDNNQGQACYRSPDGSHLQKNPLIYANFHTSPFTREAGCISESPFLKRTDEPYPDHSSWPADITSASNNLPINAPQSRSYTQSHHLRKEYMPASSLHLYTASFDRPYDKSPYEAFCLRYRNNRTDIPEINSGLRPYSELHNEQYAGNTTIRSEPTLPTLVRERLPNFETNVCPTVPRTTHTSAPSLSQAFSSPQNVRASGRDLKSDLRNRTLKEEICAILDNMNAASQSNPKHTLASQKRVSIGSKSSIGHDNQQSSISLGRASWAPGNPETRRIKTKRGGGSSHWIHSEKGSFELPGPPSLERPDPGTKISEDRTHMSPHCNLGDLPERSATPASRIIKPPPGLPGQPRKITSGTGLCDQSAVIKETRIDDTNVWFHRDGRGEDLLRHHIADIAENYVDKGERIGGETLSTQNNTTTKRTILLLGNVIANLHSYVSGDRQNQAANFANFGLVGPRYCERSLAGQRSYFDRDPTVDHWNISMDPASPNYDSDPD